MKRLRSLPLTATEILEELKPLGRESYKRVLTGNHGVKEPCFGVSVRELRKSAKCILGVRSDQGDRSDGSDHVCRENLGGAAAPPHQIVR